jgi:hypothetical protein
MKPQALDKSFCYKCNGTKLKGGWSRECGAGFSRVSEKSLKKVKKRLKK